MIFKKTISEGLFDYNKDWFRQVFSEYYLTAERGISSTLLYFELHGVSILFSPKLEQDVFRKEFLLGELFYAYKTIRNEGKYNNRLLKNIYITEPNEKNKYNEGLLVLFLNEDDKKIKAKIELYLKSEHLKIERAEFLEKKQIENELLKFNQFFIKHGIDCRCSYLKNSLTEKRTAARSFNKLRKVLNELKLNEDDYKLLPSFNFTLNNDNLAKLRFENNLLFIKTTVAKEDLYKVLRHLIDKRQQESQPAAEPDIIEYIATTNLLDIDTDYFIKLVPAKAALIKKFIMFYHPDKWHQTLNDAEKEKLTELTQKLTEKLANCRIPK